ncbi:MAG: hypothetical protein ACREET_18660 [Stellaceae bacterium]
MAATRPVPPMPQTAQTLSGTPMRDASMRGASDHFGPPVEDRLDHSGRCRGQHDDDPRDPSPPRKSV